MGWADFWVSFLGYFPATLLQRRKEIANSWMVNCGCGFELFPDELHSKSNSQQNLSVQINTLLPQQRVWVLQVKWERLEATSDLLLPQLPPNQEIKNKYRKANLPHILLLLGYWIPEQEEGFNSAFREMKCHCLKKKKLKKILISLLELRALKAGGEIRCVEVHHFIRDLLCFTAPPRVRPQAGWHCWGDALGCFTALPGRVNAIFIKPSCFT